MSLVATFKKSNNLKMKGWYFPPIFYAILFHKKQSYIANPQHNYML